LSKGTRFELILVEVLQEHTSTHDCSISTIFRFIFFMNFVWLR
jgi:hypothetical protein